MGGGWAYTKVSSDLDSSGVMPSMCVVKVGDAYSERRPVRGCLTTSGCSTSFSRIGASLAHFIDDVFSIAARELPGWPGP